MVSKRRLELVVLSLLMTSLLCLASEHSDTGPYALEGQVIVTDSQFQSFFYVTLLRDGIREVGRVRVSSMTHFQFTRLAAGTYELTLTIPGFKAVRERVYLQGPQLTISTKIFAERQVTLVHERSGITSVREYDGDNLISAEDLGKYPNDLAREIRAAHEEVLEKDFENALQDLDGILDEFPQYYPARRDRGVVYQKLGRYIEARADYEVARTLNPSSPVPLIYLASLSLQEAASPVPPDSRRGLIAAALDYLLHAIQIWPQSSFAHYLLGVTYYEAEFYEDAEDNFVLTLRLDPEFSETHLGLTNLYIRMQEWTKALSHLDTFLAANQKSQNIEDLQAIRSRIQRMIEGEEKHLTNGRQTTTP